MANFAVTKNVTMAHGKGNFLLQGISGNLGKEIVIKQYGAYTVIGRFPRMPKKKATPLRDLYEDRFKEAVKYAQAILANRELKQQYALKVKPGQRIYNYAIKEYMTLAKAGKIVPQTI
jgi:hypothetical protein